MLRYLLYDVNPPEGFNLRRDVYIRMASLLKTLRKEGDWVLVLPPWGRLYHWQSPDIHQVRIPWGEFFSITSLQANIPVIEYEEFIAGEPCCFCLFVWDWEITIICVYCLNLTVINVQEKHLKKKTYILFAIPYGDASGTENTHFTSHDYAWMFS